MSPESNIIEQVVDRIWSELNTIENSDKSKEEQLEIIKPILLLFYLDITQIQRNTIKGKLEKVLQEI